MYYNFGEINFRKIKSFVIDNYLYFANIATFYIKLK